MNEFYANDMIELKASLLVEGIKATKEALLGIGSDYKEQNHGLFGWDMEDHAAEIVLGDKVASGTENHCYRCDGNNLLHDALRERGLV